MVSARTAADHFFHSRSVQSHSLRLRSHLHHSRLIRQRDCGRPSAHLYGRRLTGGPRWPRCDATEACTVAAKQRFAYTAVALTKRAKRYGQAGEGMSGTCGGRRQQRTGFRHSSRSRLLRLEPNTQARADMCGSADLRVQAWVRRGARRSAQAGLGALVESGCENELR